MKWQSYMLASHLKLINYKQVNSEIILMFLCPHKTLSGFRTFQEQCTEPAGAAYKSMLKDYDQSEFIL